MTYGLQAIEDAAVLGYLLCDASGDAISKKLQRYSDLRAPRAGTVQLISRLIVTKDWRPEQLPSIGAVK